eukprot:CAMPEP_0175695674 /NCGR_PEP_ID=MMETSP0097-20121207/32559_1 /TAXON_ID=311494 /ORGANISM="Alexandrium monilatum, Strain CCMP3105" /LENGTH=379 /DNA_ID=CAMNT_0017002811 /DNA_START=164 /DNA_END=1302 /DNA_ORIENTATION=+
MLDAAVGSVQADRGTTWTLIWVLILATPSSHGPARLVGLAHDLRLHDWGVVVRGRGAHHRALHGGAKVQPAPGGLVALRGSLLDGEAAIVVVLHAASDLDAHASTFAGLEQMDFTLGLVHHALDFGDPVVVLRRAAHDAVVDSQGVARGLRLPVLGVRAREGGVVGQRPLVWRQALAGLPHAVELCIRLLPALHLEIEVHTGTDEPEDGDDAEDDEQDRTFTIFLYALVERIAEEELASCDALGAWLRAAGQAVMAAAVWSRRWRDRRLTRQRGSPAGGAVGGDVGLTIVRDYGGALHRARVALVAVVSVAPTGAAAMRAAAQNDESGVGTDAHGARGVDCPGAAPKAAAAATSLVVDTDTVGIEPVVAVEPERHDLGG